MFSGSLVIAVIRDYGLGYGIFWGWGRLGHSVRECVALGLLLLVITTLSILVMPLEKVPPVISTVDRDAAVAVDDAEWNALERLRPLPYHRSLIFTVAVRIMGGLSKSGIVRHYPPLPN